MFLYYFNILILKINFKNYKKYYFNIFLKKYFKIQLLLHLQSINIMRSTNRLKRNIMFKPQKVGINCRNKYIKIQSRACACGKKLVSGKTDIGQR